VADTILRFVDSDLITVRLALDYVESETHIPYPEHLKNWAESSQADGRKMVGDGKYNNIPIDLTLKIKGTDAPDLDDKLQALATEITRKNILEYRPIGASESVFYVTYPYSTGNPRGLLERALRENFIAFPSISLEAELPFGAEEEIQIIENLLPNWSLEDYAGTGATYNPDGWTATRVNGAGLATVEEYSTKKVFGDYSVNLEITTKDGEAQIETTDYIPIDRTHEYYLLFNHYKIKTFIALVMCNGISDDYVFIDEYDAGNNLLASTGIDPGGDPSAWYLSVTRKAAWDVDCTKVKIRIKIYFVGAQTAEISWLFDGMLFADSYFLNPDCGPSNPAAIVIPAAETKGDVPALCDIHISKFDEDVKTMTSLYFGGRKNYDAEFLTILEADPGLVTGPSNLASGGRYCVVYIGAELILKNSFNTIVGVAGSNTETWTNWTEVRGGSGYLIAYAGGRALTPFYVAPREGTYMVVSYIPVSGAAMATNTLTSDLTAVTIANDHYFSIWYILRNLSGLGQFKVEIECYTAAPALTGTLTVVDTMTTRNSWTPANLEIEAADWPALTTQVKIKVTSQVARAVGQSGAVLGEPAYDKAFFDFCSLKEGSPFFLGRELLSKTEGRSKPFLHYKITAVQVEKKFSLAGRLWDSGTGYTPWIEIDNPQVDLPGTWTFQGDGYMDPFEIPNFGLPSDEDTPAAFYQELQAKMDSAVAATTMHVDAMALIPTDNGYAVLGADDSRHLIIDSQGDMPAFLRSFDGTKANSIILDTGKVKPFKLDPQNGSNFACLLVWTDGDGNQPAQFLADLKIKYYPRYLVVA